MTLLLFGILLGIQPANAAGMTCDEIMSMVDSGFDASIIGEAIRTSGDAPSTETIACLEERGASSPIIKIAQQLSGETVSSSSDSKSSQPEEGTTAAAPIQATSIALPPTSESSSPKVPAAVTANRMVIRAPAKFYLQCGNGPTEKFAQTAVVKMEDKTHCTIMMRGRSGEFFGHPGSRIECQLATSPSNRVSCRDDSRSKTD